MGIVNVTPDSFSDGGKYHHTTQAVRHALQLASEGANVLDIGGESSRPGAKPVTTAEELKRVLPVIRGIRKKSQVAVSIDTYKPAVAKQALQAGANWVNDITGLRHPEMRSLVAKQGCPVVLMHMLGDPQSMQDHPRYHDVVTEIIQFFRTQLRLAKTAGIKETKVILDPGIGFGKTVQHNLEIIHRLHEIKMAFPKVPILIGASRKSFIGKLTGANVTDRLPGTLAVHARAVAEGANWLRVHDVAAHQQFFDLY